MRQLDFLEAREDRETFFLRVHKFVLPYHDDGRRIADAYKFVKDDFRGKKRKRGERAFEHSRAVALILFDVVGVRNPDTIIGALMHDMIEDNGWTKEMVASELGETVAFLVDGVSMPEGNFPTREVRMDAYHQKFLKAMEKDIRVLMIKLADRLHNLTTCEALSRENQLRMVEETEQIYLPLAKKHNILLPELSQILRVRRKSLRAVTKSHRVRITKST